MFSKNKYLFLHFEKIYHYYHKTSSDKHTYFFCGLLSSYNNTKTPTDHTSLNSIQAGSGMLDAPQVPSFVLPPASKFKID